MMRIRLWKEDQIGITLTVLLSSKGKPYVWKAVDISSEHENYTAVMDKIEIMLTDLKKKDITVYAIVVLDENFKEINSISAMFCSLDQSLYR
ncbi:unnamed protein product [Rhizophagus irregularis]|nr:unnamed protein product [Rhizophagus irregularis]CAB4439621.1 unnamed protein product [Rhizophagus irregularis]